jgi:hypothetical protein
MPGSSNSLFIYYIGFFNLIFTIFGGFSILMSFSATIIMFLLGDENLDLNLF